MLFMFTDMVRLIPDGSGIEGFIARGLGSHIAATVPLLFLSVVVAVDTQDIRDSMIRLSPGG